MQNLGHLVGLIGFQEDRSCGHVEIASVVGKEVPVAGAVDQQTEPLAVPGDEVVQNSTPGHRRPIDTHPNSSVQVTTVWVAGRPTAIGSDTHSWRGETCMDKCLRDRSPWGLELVGEMCAIGVFVASVSVVAVVVGVVWEGWVMYGIGDWPLGVGVW